MSSAGPNVLQAALRLPPDERAQLITALIDSLDGPPDPSAAAAWEDEIARRVKQIENGAAELVDWTEARARVVTALSKPRR